MFQRTYPLVRQPAVRVGGHKPVDFMRGPSEMTEAIRDRRPCRLSAELGVHIVEIVEALDDPGRFGGHRAARDDVSADAPDDMGRVNRQMLVSILIPCFNAERWIAQAIESALAQTWPNAEVIVVDDGSTDGSLEVIKSFGSRIRWETGQNRGGGAARNRLLELARGEWIQYLDADDYLLPEKIEGQMAFVAARADADVVFGAVTMAYWSKEGERHHLLPIPQPHDLWVLLARWYLPQTGALLWRRQALVDLGGWKPDQPCCQEHELYLRALIAGKRFAYCATNGAVYRQWSEADSMQARQGGGQAAATGDRATGGGRPSIPRRADARAAVGDQPGALRDGANRVADQPERSQADHRHHQAIATRLHSRRPSGARALPGPVSRTRFPAGRAPGRMAAPNHGSTRRSLTCCFPSSFPHTTARRC